MHDLGVALSGGGSRAAAFHCGTLSALVDLGLLDQVGVVSTVSGGSVFGAAWMAARAKRIAEKVFLKEMRRALEKGFLLKALGLYSRRKVIRWSEYTRSYALVDALDEYLYDGLILGDLPRSPVLCINATILNNGQVAKFDREGFSAWDIRVPRSVPRHLAPMPEFPLAQAVVASASFPIGIPPFVLNRDRFPSNTEFLGPLQQARAIYLSDGGVLENLGVQTLLLSKRFRSWDIIQSDAGTRYPLWQGPNLRDQWKSALMALFGGSSFKQVTSLMSDKQTRWARSEIFNAQMKSWLIDEVRARKIRGFAPSRELEAYLADFPSRPRRRVMFIGIDQDWNQFFRNVPQWRLEELATQSSHGAVIVPSSGDASTVVKYLESVGCNLSAARNHYRLMGGDRAIPMLNDVKTSFCALPRSVVRCLVEHAAWQVHATHAVYYAHRSPNVPKSTTRYVPS